MSRTYAAADFGYDYPPDLIAQRPVDRGTGRLLVLDRETGTVAHKRFADFPKLVDPGDVLVINTSKVVPARLIGERDNGRPAELLVVHAEPDGTWLAMAHPGGKLKPGRIVRFGDEARAEVVEVLGGGLRRVRFGGTRSVRALMERYGTTPLPPYIERPPEDADRERYQTVYAREEGSVAAPTAGLHFTGGLMDAVRERGAEFAEVVLHVGPGTFKPVEADDPADHVMHAEWYEVPDDAANRINAARRAGGRIWAIGTTAARTLETVALDPPGDRNAGVTAGAGWTDLFIRPRYRFRAVNALLTNFHLPRSTLLMLVAAYAGYEHTMDAYREAIARRYRLFSYGDAMAVV